MAVTLESKNGETRKGPKFNIGEDASDNTNVSVKHTK